MKLKNQIANLITSIRILGAIILFFLKPLSRPFFVVYTFCGLSDAVDGFTARKLKTVSDFGSKLDSVADLTFYTAMMLKIIPYLVKHLEIWNWVFLFLVLAIRISAYTVSAIKFRKFASVHSIMNKATGAGVFALPYFTLFNPFVFNIYSTVVCTVGFVASSSELLLHLRKKT